MKKLIFIFVFAIFTIALVGQDYIVSGRVTAFGEIAVSSFPVIAKKSGMETLTDTLGYFSIECKSKDQIIFKGKPFVTQKIRINSQDSVNINLIFIDGDKSKDLIVEHGYMSPEDIIYAVRELSDNNTKFFQYQNIYDLLRSQFSDVEISDSKAIFIRGQAQSLTLDNSALLIVNGVEVRDISTIQPINVKTIQRLKGSEAAFYGSRGANGVIVITLK